MSTKLNRAYVNLEKIALFEMKGDGTPGLSVRALMVYTEADKLKTPVMRCANHKDKDLNPNHPGAYLKCPFKKFIRLCVFLFFMCLIFFSVLGYEHVLACENDKALYVTDKHSRRHSVLLTLHLQQGALHALVNSKFICMSTCSSLTRAQTDVIFTLEDPM